MKNAGKACNNRLYRHIRTFEKIIKNYFVIYYKCVIMKWIKMYMRKELNGMFTEGQLVIYGGEGVCRIAAVGPSSLSGTDKTKLYYTLTPLTRSGTVLTPVDTKVLMRPILTRQEAEDFIAQLPQLPPEEPESRSMRLLKEFYQQIVTSYDCRRMAGLIRSAVRTGA